MIYRRDRGTGVISGLTNRAGERNTGRAPAGSGEHELVSSPTGLAAITNSRAASSTSTRRPTARCRSRRSARTTCSTSANGASDRIEILNAPVTPDNAGQYIGVYLADTWTIGRRLTLNLGVPLRATTASTRTRAAARRRRRRRDLVFPGDVLGQNADAGLQLVRAASARGVRPTGDGKTVVKGGWGRYVRMRLFDHLQPMANNVISTAVYRWRDLNWNRDYDAGEVNLDPNSVGLPQPDADRHVHVRRARGRQSGREAALHGRVLAAVRAAAAVRISRSASPGIHARVQQRHPAGEPLPAVRGVQHPDQQPRPRPGWTRWARLTMGDIITWYDYPAAAGGRLDTSR